jgi:hypothetical protein
LRNVLYPFKKSNAFAIDRLDQRNPTCHFGIMSGVPNRIDVEILQDVGRLAFGDRWQRSLAAELGFSQSLISMILSGKTPMSDEFRNKLESYCQRLENELETRAATARALKFEMRMNTMRKKASSVR